MKKLILAGALALGLAGCASLSKEEETAIRDAVVAVAIETIAEAKQAGLDPLQLSASEMRLVNLACGTADKFLPILEAYIAARNADDPEFEPVDFRGYVAAACAIAEAVISVEPPAPEPKPAV